VVAGFYLCLPYHMKFLERALLMMFLIGLYFVFLQKPADYSLLWVSAVSFAILYILCMPLLLQDIRIADLGRKEIRAVFRWHHVVNGVLFGLFNAYAVFSITFNLLGKMDNLALVENCGIFLVLFGAISFWGVRVNPDGFYRRLLIRIAILSAWIITAVVLDITLPSVR